MSTGQADAALAVEGMSVAFGGVQALSGVALHVQPGEIVGIIGPNGAGKTTLFDCLSGHLAGTGRIWLSGREITGLPPHRRAAAGLGRSYQDARLYPSLTVWDTLRCASELNIRAQSRWALVLGTRAARRAEISATTRAGEIVDLMGLGSYAGKFVRELSTGTRRIVDLGCLLVQRPRVILFDEPSSGIAQSETAPLGRMIARMKAALDATLVIIEHDIPLVTSLADRLIAMESGRIIADGTPESVRQSPAVIESYLGADPRVVARSDVALARDV